MSRLRTPLAVTAAIALLAAIAAAEETGPFEKVHCLRYALAPDVSLSLLVAGVDPSEKADLPFVICVARRGKQAVVLDAGYVDTAYGEEWGAAQWVDLPELLKEVGVAAEDVSLVTLSHLHWDHAGGTSRFPNARFVMQRRELAFATTDMPGHKFAEYGFRAEEVLDAVRLRWEGRLDLVDGDVEGYRPGIDLYLTPGHTMGTMTVCLATVKGRICYSSDAVYTYRNIEEERMLGIALLPYETLQSYQKIRDVLRGGKLIPGHEPGLFSNPGAYGFEKVSDRAIAIVD